MKNFYCTVLFFAFNLCITAQTIPTGNSAEVGITEGQLSVSLTGGATYSIPIAVPPGINGVVPQISLAYNSQGGNGMAGYGWNISGVSVITRIPATKFHDNTIDPVDFDSLDRFAFDGQRLIIKNGTNGVYGANETVYETEGFSNVKITSFGVHPSGANYGPAYFIVEYPDGSKAHYGNSADSRSITDWAITYWENPQGVRISYAYSLTGNTLDISSIKYGSLTTNIPVNEIKFKYSPRKRTEQAYIAGVSVVRNTILKEINVIGNGVGYRNYVLESAPTSLNYERLSSIVEKSGDNTKSYNPTIFTYDTTFSDVPLKIAQPATLGMSGINNVNSDYISGDFDNDGKTDIILYPKIAAQKDNFTMFFDIVPGKLNFGRTEKIGTFENIFPATFLSSDNKIMPQGWAVIKKTDTGCAFSVYGEGFTGIFLNHYEKKYNLKTTLTHPDADRSNCNLYYPVPADVTEKIPMDYLSGDFNGDGLTDVIAVERSFAYTIETCDYSHYDITNQREYYDGGKACFFNLDRRIAENETVEAGQIQMPRYAADAKLIVADFNGDGKSDIYVFETGFVKIYTLDNDNKLVLLCQNATADTGIVLNKPILFGDYNGDGKADFVIPQTDNKDSWNFYFSTGTNFNKLNTAIGLAYYTSYTGYFAVVGFSVNTYSLNEGTFIANDYNGDGKTDILYQQNLTVEYILNEKNIYARKGEPQITKLILLENISCEGNSISFNLIDKPSQFAGVKRNAIPVFTNHNKINQNLEYSLISDNSIISFNSPKDNRTDVLLKGITTGNGVKETITYKTLQQDPYDSIYTPTALAEAYPNTDIVVVPGFKIVSLLEKQSTSDYKKQLFSYYGAVSNVEGLGFLGFRGTMRTNWFNDSVTQTCTVSKNDINLRGANIENYSVLGMTSSYGQTPSVYISRSLLTYQSELLPNKVFKLKNTLMQQYNGLDNTGSETATLYDTYNNPAQSTTILKEGAATVQTTVSNVAYDNRPTASTYYIGRPVSKNQSVTVTGDTMTSEELYVYTNHLLTQVKKKGHNTDYITEDNVYDTYGNITKKSITATGLTPRVTNYEYDSSGRFLTKSIDIEGLTTTFDYNLSSGVLNKETNPYGLTTSYLYDSWFKKTKTTDYLGKNNTYSYARNGNVNTLVTTTGDDGSYSEELFDDLGRKIRTGVKDITGTMSSVDYLYDIYDRNYKTSEPYSGGSPAQWNETRYDDYGRPVQNISHTGKTVTISYSGLTTTVNDGTKTKISTKNAMGNVITMTESPIGGTVNYSYFANGNLKSSDYDGVTTTIEQDGWGRKTGLTDPSAGNYAYEYNALGETTKETTPNGTTTYTLDDVGKLIAKTIVGNPASLTNSSTTYTYDNSTKLLTGSIFTNTLEGGTVTANRYEYDGSKRLFKTTETTPYASFIKHNTFDAFGRVDTETSTATVPANGKTSSKIVKNTYKNGTLWQILDDATQQVLWQTNEVNERGQLTKALLGNGIAITNQYDAYGFAARFKHDRTGGNPANIMTLNTAFDAQKGNLTNRSNSLFGWSESFQYDSLDRLTNYTNAQGVQETQAYDDRGRITQNNLGTYRYTKTNEPYQNTSVLPTPEALAYYETKPLQTVSYNTFKSPVEIVEKDTDKISFTYNDNNNRSAMFYGSLDNDKLLRPNRKFYSADGTMEVKYNKNTGATEFVTYIGGDGYSAPIALKSDGTTQNYLYLHRDYQGSILAITDADGAVLEKRQFDAWGNIVKVQDGAGNTLAGLTVLDRGYTGHEHLQSVGLINMNGRIYDPKLHRFLQPDNFVQDPSSTGSFNRYAYCWNNPLKFTDPSGEFVPLIIGAIIVVSAAVNVYQNWGNITGGTGKFSDIKWGKLTAYAGTGAVAGALTVYGGPYGVLIAGGYQNLSNSLINGDDFGTTIQNTVSGIVSGGLTLGFGQGLGLVFPNGLVGAGNPILKEGINNIFGTVVSSFVVTSSLTGNINQGFKAAFDPVNIASAAILGSLEGVRQIPNTTKVPVEVIKQNQPVLESLQLKSIPVRSLPQNVVIPPTNVFMPQRTVIPQKYNYNFSQNKFKG